MYRILIADDEGLMLEAFKGVILAELVIGDVIVVEDVPTVTVIVTYTGYPAPHSLSI